MNSRLDYNKIDDELLIALYSKQRVTVDRLPYTREFDRMLKFCPKRTTKRDLWLNLTRLRKAGMLPRLDKP